MANAAALRYLTYPVGGGDQLRRRDAGISIVAWRLLEYRDQGSDYTFIKVCLTGRDLMRDSLKKLFDLLNATERSGFVVLVGLMLFEAALEIASLYLVPAYIGLLAYPGRVARYLPLEFSSMERMDTLAGRVVL